MAQITRVEVHVFGYEVPDLELPAHGAAGVGNLVFRKGGRLPCTRYAVTIDSSDGARGAYVTHWVGTPAALAQTLMLAPHLLGRDPDAREAIYDDLKREVRAYDHMGHGPLDIALWDLAGQRLGSSVARLLGGFRTRLPTYASTYHGQDSGGGLDSPEAFADYALACKERGFAGFKIHGWHDGDARREAANALGVRKAVGDGWPLDDRPGLRAADLDGRAPCRPRLRRGRLLLVRGPLSRQRRLGRRPPAPAREAEDAAAGQRACARAGAEGGVHAGRRLRHDPRRPRIRHGHHRCGEDRPFLRGHGAGPPVPRLRPGAPRGHGRHAQHPLLRDGADRAGHAERGAAGLHLRLLRPAGRPRRDGCVPVPDGPGLGVTYDWAFIEKNRRQHHVFARD